MLSAPRSLPPIIGFSGRAGAGKSTAANIVVSTYEQCYRLSFADPIRRMLHCIGLTATDLQRDKEIPHLLIGGKTPRYAMQTLGTDWARQMIDPELWLRVARHHALKIMDGGGIPVFDDVRFDNEAEMIRHLGGEVIQITRRTSTPNPRPQTPDPRGHPSEGGVSSRFLTTTVIAAEYDDLRTVLHSHFNARADRHLRATFPA